MSARRLRLFAIGLVALALAFCAHVDVRPKPVRASFVQVPPVSAQYSFVLRPGGTAGNNVYTSWASLMAVATSPSRVLVDDSNGASPAHVTTGTWNIDQFRFMGAQRTAGGADILIFDAGAVVTFSNLYLDYVRFQENGTAAAWTAPSGQSRIFLGNQAGFFVNTGTATTPWASIQSGATLLFNATQGSSIGDTTHACITLAAGGTLSVSLRDKGSAIQANAVTGGAGTFTISAADDSTWSTTQSPTPTVTLAGLASQMSYTPGAAANWSTVPTTPAGALDTLAATNLMKLTGGATQMVNASAAGVLGVQALPISACSGDLNAPCTTVNSISGGVGGVVPITNPIEIGSAPFPTTGAYFRLPWVGAAGVTPFMTQRNSGDTVTFNVLGSSTDNATTLQIGDDAYGLINTHGNYVDITVANNLQVFWKTNNNDIMQVGENGGGAFGIVDTNNDGFTMYTWNSNGTYKLSTGTTSFYNGGVLGTQTLQETIGPGGITPNNIIVSGVTGGTLTLSAAQYIMPIIRLQGTLTSALTVVFPNQAGKWEVSISQLAAIGVVNTVTFQSGSATTSALTALLPTSQVVSIYTYGSNTIDINQ